MSRAFALYLVDSNTPNANLFFQVIGSDGGLLTKPVQAFDLASEMITAHLGIGFTCSMDPMEERWRAKPYAIADLRTPAGPFFDIAIDEPAQFIASTVTYNKVNNVCLQEP
ncbi:multicopper oxidase [Colletotrichum tofieldiae]|uniref:Multicopper oxidase n=1 Tax=Colletotrichum tofieldiae TaxID=708197 RepID=A0A166S0T7_9PEZI|nr:multicopper oxidase [Colletotrichum tofieldiae]GKT64032.1 multicopper oxidase [Colletotrichum tofieldiae]GKT71997.1 multicopper oxidase [Colletotrichum tofieldiae]GKT90224.1 multicopper oxidase [Colletotrichum tofieldiae]